MNQEILFSSAVTGSILVLQPPTPDQVKVRRILLVHPCDMGGRLVLPVRSRPTFFHQYANLLMFKVLARSAWAHFTMLLLRDASAGFLALLAASWLSVVGAIDLDFCADINTSGMERCELPITSGLQQPL